MRRIPKKIKGSFPLTILNSEELEIKPSTKVYEINTSIYQNKKLNPQQFYKPISKILDF